MTVVTKSMNNEKQNLTTVYEPTAAEHCSHVEPTPPQLPEGLSELTFVNAFVGVVKAAVLRDVVDSLLLSVEFIEAVAQQIGDKISLNKPRQQFYSTKQVAAMTKSDGRTAYTPFSIRAACRDGRIVAVKNQNGYMIHFSEVQKLLDKGL
jgi:hypothetical protein